MRAIGKGMLLVAGGVLVAGWAIAQQPGGFGGFGRGQGGQQDVLSILRNKAVKDALKISDEQLAKVPEAVLKALGDVLTKEQLARFKQIELQQRGPQAFRDPNVQTALKMTDEQKEGVSSVLSDSQAALQELFKEMTGGKGGFGGGQGMQEKMAAIRKDTADRVTSILTADQRKQWREMIGDELKLETPGFGGQFGKGGTGGFKKKRTDK